MYKFSLYCTYFADLGKRPSSVKHFFKLFQALEKNVYFKNKTFSVT